MIVNLHIERLVVEGLSVGPHQAPRIEAALGAELSRLIAEGGLSAPVLRGRCGALVRAAPIDRPAGDGDVLGAQIGRSVYEGIGQ